jgi:hypothetical protein
MQSDEGGPCTCDDGLDCTVDSCEEGWCSHSGDDGLCDDGDPCTSDYCDPEQGCQAEYRCDWNGTCP